MSNSGRGSHKEHACAIISKSIHWLKRRNRLKGFLFLAVAAILFNRGKRFVQFQGIFLYNNFKIHPLVEADKSFKSFFLFLAHVARLFNGAEQFEQFW